MIIARSNGSPEGNAFLARLHEIEREYTHQESVWLTKMKEEYDPALVHPDDGCVDRQRNTVHPVYPQHQRIVKVGDLMVLGHHDKWRVVRCTSDEISRLSVDPYNPSHTYGFVALPKPSM
jgi:hypothetical protein